MTAAAPAQRGYHVAYRPGEANRCPGCGHSWWLVGRSSAECWSCGTALPFASLPLNAARSGLAPTNQGEF